MRSPTARDAAEGLREQIERLRVASEAAPAGNAFTCGPPWFRHGSGVLVGSPDPHAGHLVADTDTSFLRDDEGPPPDWDDDAIAAFLSEAWNFARLILSRPDLITAFRSAGTEGGGTQGVGPGRALRDGLSPDGRTAARSEPSAFDPARTAAPFSRDEIHTLYDECRGWHAALDDRADSDGAITIRCAHGLEHEQTRLNMRAWMRDVGTVLLGILSRVPASGIEARSAETWSGLAEGKSPTPPGVMPDPAVAPAVLNRVGGGGESGGEGAA